MVKNGKFRAGVMQAMSARVGEVLLVTRRHIPQFRASGRRLLTLIVLLAASAPSAAAQSQFNHLTDIVAVTVDAEERERYGFIQQQIYRGESPQAVEALQQTIDRVQQAQHRYHEELVVPLTLLGDAMMVQQDIDAALDHYDRARHVARVSFGLFDPRQIPVVYREAEALRKSGNLQQSGQREEYAFEVVRKAYPEYDPKALPAAYRLARFYLETSNELPARAIYQYALQIHQANGSADTVEAIPALQGIAHSHRLERFPIFFASLDEPVREAPSVGLRGNELDQQYVSFNNFPAGERALQQIVAIRQAEQPPDHVATFEAMLELADWHLLFDRTRTATTLYGHVFEQMQINGEDAAAFFAQPRLIYFPRPSDPVRPPPDKRGEPVQGKVTLQFDVGANGRVRSMQTVASVPRRLMDFKVRRSMRYAVYRPRLAAPDQPEIGRQLQFTHKFNYFPLKNDTGDVQDDDATVPGEQQDIPADDEESS